ncbi:hypothetical protein D9619_012001 [Psilocybe cf. subviscida]|uniref:Uncharacterized protein n=1 Tax=Psilocybe cf. subviscida TaxID=2480587 RepID=A0A8H5EVR8_9AGAR|nr:hypothetical protein D9619_012001 [Psilocybe cf. subviscida]
MSRLESTRCGGDAKTASTLEDENSKLQTHRPSPPCSIHIHSQRLLHRPLSHNKNLCQTINPRRRVDEKLEDDEPDMLHGPHIHPRPATAGLRATNFGV